MLMSAENQMAAISVMDRGNREGEKGESWLAHYFSTKEARNLWQDWSRGKSVAKIQKWFDRGYRVLRSKNKFRKERRTG